jgi:hypothetical protein
MPGTTSDPRGNWPGLIAILTVVAAIALLFTGSYPRQIFDFVLGLNRWVLRVAAYAGLMTDAYPPFRLDMGGDDPATVVCSLGLLGAGGAALWADTAARHGGYLNVSSETYRTSGYAVASDSVDLHWGGGWYSARSLLGTIRIRAESTAGAGVFIGIAPSGTASGYLSGVAHATVSGPAGSTNWYVEHGGTAPAALPARAVAWDVYAAGPGTQTVIWPVRSGSWTVVAMNADGSRPVSVHVDVGATLPALPWVEASLLAAGVVALAGGIVLLVIPIRRASG